MKREAAGLRRKSWIIDERYEESNIGKTRVTDKETMRKLGNEARGNRRRSTGQSFKSSETGEESLGF